MIIKRATDTIQITEMVTVLWKAAECFIHMTHALHCSRAIYQHRQAPL